MTEQKEKFIRHRLEYYKSRTFYPIYSPMGLGIKISDIGMIFSLGLMEVKGSVIINRKRDSLHSLEMENIMRLSVVEKISRDMKVYFGENVNVFAILSFEYLEQRVTHDISMNDYRKHLRKDDLERSYI